MNQDKGKSAVPCRLDLEFLESQLELLEKVAAAPGQAVKRRGAKGLGAGYPL